MKKGKQHNIMRGPFFLCVFSPQGIIFVFGGSGFCGSSWLLASLASVASVAFGFLASVAFVALPIYLYNVS